MVASLLLLQRIGVRSMGGPSLSRSRHFKIMWVNGSTLTAAEMFLKGN